MESLLTSNRFGNGRSLRKIQADLDALQHRSGETGLRVTLSWSTSVSSGTLANVAARLEGRDATVNDCVVLGAHRDHFGRQAGLLFPGADDNASGTAILLETARILAASPVRPKRAVVFVSFSGEERGLLGSRLYTAAPPYPLRDTIAMVNVDHAGIGNGRLTVGLDGITKERAARGVPPTVADRLDLFGFFPGGDHVPFKEAGVPTAAVVSSGKHPHFHRPEDAPPTLSAEQLAAAAAYVVALVWELAEN
jgi:Zn-dependent M28 family amino/carboxypeptidase